MSSRSNPLIYFIKPVGLDGPIKIGSSGTPVNRLETLAAWSPWPLEVICAVPGSYKDEFFLHSCFADCRSHKEWFHSTPKLRETISAIKDAGTLEAVKPHLTPVGKAREGTRFTPERKRYLSYCHRLNWAERKLRKQLGEDAPWRMPDDVGAIKRRWTSYGGNPQEPTDREIKRLEEYLADPAAHSVIPEWRRKKEAA